MQYSDLGEMIGCILLFSMIHFLCYLGNVETAKILLDAGAKVSTTNSIGKTAQDLSSFVGKCMCDSTTKNSPGILAWHKGVDLLICS